jgi:Rrf2 family protein
MAQVKSGGGRKGPLSPVWFGTAIQALVALANADGVSPSAAIADRVQAHPVFLRRIFSQLVRAGLVDAREGRDGGYRLGRSPEEITLADVYRALNEAEFPALQVLEPPAPAVVGMGMCGIFGEIAQRIDDRIVEVLADYTLADLLDRAGAPHCAHEAV